MTEEPADSNYTTWKTCGYFYPEDDIDCQDWAYDTIDGSITSGNAQPQNVMYRGSGIFTRHFYEAACIYYHGGCESTQKGIFHLETLATNLYLNGNGHTGQVVIDRLGEAEPAFWDADIVRREHDYTYITLQLHYTRTCNDCPFTLLICNPTTGEVKTTWPEYYFHPNNSQEFIGWKHEWVVDQIADGIVTLECGPFDDSFLKWEPSVSRPILAVPSKPDQEHWTSHFQWRINR
jgi:hypothetical protein